MDKRYRHILRYALAAVPLACVALLSSCSFDDDYDGSCDSGAPVAVRINVSAGEPGDLNGTRAGDDVNADEHEFMHTLYLCILDEQGYVQEMFHAEDGSLQNLIVSEPAAATGDIFNWTSDEFTLPVGTYTIYAFANVDGYIGENDQTEDVDVMRYLQDQFRIGAGVRTDLPRFRLNDPASKIDFANDMYIPMSAKKTITITPNTRDISIGLDRLVSKVQLTVPSDEYVSTNSTVQFSGYSQNVPLLGADNGGYGNAQLYGERTAASKAMPFNQPGDVVSFYVNETNTGAPFTVTFNTGKSGNGGISTYVAKTQCTDIPRNSIYPLSLTFPEFGFSLEPTAWLYVTGVPYAVYYKVEENVLTVELATGSYFNFTPSNVTDNDGEHQAIWSWTVPEQQYGLNIQTNQDGVIEGNVPAGNEYIGYKYTLHLNGKWTDNAGHSFDRSYTVVVDVCHNEAWAIANRIQGGTTTRCAKAEAPVYMLAPEYLNMFKMK